MTENQIIPMKLTLEDLIRANVPADPFEAVLYYDAMTALLQNLSADCCHESGDQLSKIRSEDLSSEKWELAGIPRNESRLLYEKLRDEQPKLWFDCLTISAANAVRLLGGEDEIKKLVIKKRGREDFTVNSGLTLGTARKKLTKAQQEEYIQTETFIREYKIIPKHPGLTEGK